VPTAHLLFRAFAFYVSMDKLTWFKFSPADWMMGRIRKMPKETQADFLSLCCIYWNTECGLSVEDAELEIGEESLTKLVKYKIVKKGRDSIGIHFLDEQWNEIHAKTDHQSRSGQLGNLKRWHPMLYSSVMKGEQSLDDAYATIRESVPDSPQITTQSRNIAEKIREEEKREEERVNARENSFATDDEIETALLTFAAARTEQTDTLCKNHDLQPRQLKAIAQELISHYRAKGEGYMPKGTPYYILSNWLLKGKQFARNGNGKPEQADREYEPADLAKGGKYYHPIIKPGHPDFEEMRKSVDRLKTAQ
jgi:hypothetical protein